MALKFDQKTIIPIRKVSRKENTCVLSNMMFHENRNNIIFNALSLFVYFIIDNYLCVDCLGLQKVKLYS